MTLRRTSIALIGCGLAATVAFAQRVNPNPLRMLTKTIYTPKTEFFAVYRPYVVGQEGRLGGCNRVRGVVRDQEPIVYEVNIKLNGVTSLGCGAESGQAVFGYTEAMKAAVSNGDVGDPIWIVVADEWHII